MALKTLSVDEVVQIHRILVQDFGESSDPISPSGVRSMDLLESAVSRQHTGFEGKLKYSEPVSNAATLTYGICCDHPFINGNKRTALVAMLAHLDKNKFTLYNTSQDDLYDLMLQVADHTLGVRLDKRARSKTPDRLSHDEEVAELTRWLQQRCARVTRGEHVITYRQLKQILAQFDYHLESPRGNSIDVVRYADVTKGFIAKRTVRERKRIGNISWPGEGTEVGVKEIKRIRELCRLREEDGVDSDAFYSYTAVIDYFVNHYRKVLARLAKT
jgi:death-on-curing protein